MQYTAFVFLMFLSTTILDTCLCYSSGAPPSECNNLTPRHMSNAQAGAAPYKVKVKKSYYVPGENVRVSIESSADDIKGYFIQARKVGQNSAIGTFAAPPENGKFVNCSHTKSAITHNSKLAVKTINFDWVPPLNLSGNVSFYATVVKDVSTFWEKLQSPELYKREMVHENSTSTSMTMAYSTSAPTQPPTAKSTCKPDDPKCDGAKMNQSLLVLFFIYLFFAPGQNIV